MIKNCRALIGQLPQSNLSGRQLYQCRRELAGNGFFVTTAELEDQSRFLTCLEQVERAPYQTPAALGVDPRPEHAVAAQDGGLGFEVCFVHRGSTESVRSASSGGLMSIWSVGSLSLGRLIGGTPLQASG